MAEVNLEPNVNHPEGKIRLLDGTIIQGYTPERVAESAAVSNEMQLDTTGEYLCIKRPKEPRKPMCARESGKFFYEHAFFFLSHAKEVLSDSRMFLAPVPVQNGIAYTGTSGFRRPTLGVYLEWWMSCPEAVIEKHDENWLVWYISGSPLSGSNCCSMVNAAGKIKEVQVSPFMPVWSSFVKINRRYDDAKEQFTAFTLEEVFAMLGGDDIPDKEARKWWIDNFFLRSLNRLLSKRLDTYIKQERETHDELIRTRIQLHEPVLRKLYDEYLADVERIGKRLDELREQRHALKSKLKAGELTNVEYQKAVRPISKEARETQYPPTYDYDNKLRDLGIDLRMTDVTDYFYKPQNNEG
ncbi:MAG: hypothetical protein LIP02_09145 [Bacteroidales bacterium]|nr:hypothetical protein [Bacteroidales bacterium]